MAPTNAVYVNLDAIALGQLLVRASTLNTLFMTYVDVVQAGRTVELQGYLFRWMLREHPRGGRVLGDGLPGGK